MAGYPIAMTPAEAAILRRHLEGRAHYLEYGCGGSTVMAAQVSRATIYSIDTDRAWIERLKEQEDIQTALKAGRVSFRHVDIGPVGAWGLPAGETKIRNWPSYCIDPFALTDFRFDLILVDGRFRTAALLTCAVMADDAATIICHDYALRHRYSNAEKYFDTVEAADTLVVLRKRQTLNRRALHIDLLQALFEPG
ncbi:MAG: hypothetical protein U1F24_05695 [Alphaproteobacteria bacterium]